MHCNTQSMHTTHHAGVFSYAPTAPSGDGSLPQVNCTLTASFCLHKLPSQTPPSPDGNSPHHSRRQHLNHSLSHQVLWLCCAHYCLVLGGDSMSLCLGGLVLLYTLEAVFPAWLEDKALCDDLIMITTIVAVCMACIFAALYAVAILVVICYESKRRCDENCSCC